MRRRAITMAAIRRLLVAIAAIAMTGTGLVLGSAPAYACTCAQMALGSLAKNADAVFVGTVDGSQMDGDTRVYTLRVSDVYSGSPGSTTTVRTPAGSASCGVAMKADRQYMVVGEQKERHGDVTTTICSGTRPISDRAIASVEQALGPATPYRGAPDTNGGQNNGGQDSDSGNGKNQSDAPQDSASPEKAAAADDDSAATSDDGGSTSKIVIGALLAVAVGASFALPRLRRRNNRPSSNTDGE